MKAREIRIETTGQKILHRRGLIVGLALLAILILPIAHLGAQTTITLGPTTLTDGAYDTANSNQVTQQGSFTLSGTPVSYSFTNTGSTSLQFTPQTFAWFSSQNPQGGAVNGIVTPYVVLVQNTNLQAANSQQVVSYGDTQQNAATGLQSAAYISGVSNGNGSTFNVLPGQEIAIGFIDANPDGTLGTGSVVPFVTAPVANTAWYYGNSALGTYTNPPATNTGFGMIGGASTSNATTNNRAYQFDVSFTYAGTDQGAWTGLGGTALDNTTTNFATNPPSSALVQGALTDVQNDANIPAILFGDAYYVNGVATKVKTTNLTVGAGGISPSLPIIFTNNSVNYTINSSDANGIGGTTSITLVGSGAVTLTGTHTYIGSTTISAGTLQLGNGTSSGDIGLSTSNIVDNSVLAYDVFGSVTPAYPTTGSGALVKSGNGTLILVSTNAGYTAGLARTLGNFGKMGVALLAAI